MRANIALKMIEKCREQNIQVTGIDGFLLTDVTTQPTMEHSIDLSRCPLDCWDRAEAFLKPLATTDLYFEVGIYE